MEIQDFPPWGITTTPGQSQPSQRASPSSEPFLSCDKQHSVGTDSAPSDCWEWERSCKQVPSAKYLCGPRNTCRSGTNQTISRAFNMPKAKSHQHFRDHRINGPGGTGQLLAPAGDQTPHPWYGTENTNPWKKGVNYVKVQHKTNYYNLHFICVATA